MDNQTSELKKFDEFTPKGNLKIDEICQKATQVFATKGFVSARLADISHAAGISKGGIYHYFSTKEELLFVILRRFMDKTLEEQKKVIEIPSTPHEKIRIFIYQHITYYSQNVHESRLILHESHNLTSNFYNIIKDKEKEYLNLLKFFIESLIEDRHMSAEELNIITYCLIGMCNWPYQWYDPEGPMTPRELADEIYKIFIGDLPIKQL